MYKYLTRVKIFGTDGRFALARKEEEEENESMQLEIICLIYASGFLLWELNYTISLQIQAR